MNSSAATNRLFFKTVSSLYGFAGAGETSALRDAQPRFAFSAISSILSSEMELREIGWQLAKLARQACLAGQMDIVKALSEAITALPLPDEIKAAGLYYQAVVEKHSGNVERARVALAQIASAPPCALRCRAILELGKTFFDAGQPITAMPLYLEAIRASRTKDFLTGTQAQMMIAVVRSIDGDHRGALGDLERLWPMVRLASHEHPALRYDYLNSLAVELAETGRIEEAKHAIEIALRSPFADMYPNWRTTRDEIDDKGRRTSYRSRIFSLAGLLLVSAATVPQTTLLELPQADPGIAGHADLALAVGSPSANTAGPATESRTDTPPPAAAPIDPAGQSASGARRKFRKLGEQLVLPMADLPTGGRPHPVLSRRAAPTGPSQVEPDATSPRRNPSTLSSCFINEEIAPRAISKPITILQTALAPSSGYPHRNPHFSGKRGRTFQIASARSRPISQVSAPHCPARREPPDNVRAAGGNPRSPLARGPPDTSIKL
jgi:tetratricopeptide (TPR) repeat protein